MMHKKCLFLLRASPFQSGRLPEMLDIAMTLAAFEQPVSIALLDDAVWALKAPTTSASGDIPRPAMALFEALELYDVRAILVERESLQERGLVSADLATAHVVFDRVDLARFLHRHDCIWSDSP